MTLLRATQVPSIVWTIRSSTSQIFSFQHCIFCYRMETLPYYGKNISQKWAAFAFGNTNLHQAFTECASNQYKHFDISTGQMWLQVMERTLVLLHFWVFSNIIIDQLPVFTIWLPLREPPGTKKKKKQLQFKVEYYYHKIRS